MLSSTVAKVALFRPQPYSHRPVPSTGLSRSRETALFLVGFLALVVGQLALSNALSLFSRHFWYDEIMTQELVADPAVSHSMRVLSSGVEGHPPTLYLVLRVATLGGRFANEVTLRLLALAFAVTAILGIYVSLRDSFAPLPCVAGCLAVWCHPVLLTQAFEARFYGALLAGVVWYAYALRRTRDCRTVWPNLFVAALALFVCTVHYFGIIAFVLITAFELLARRPSGRFRGIFASSLGPLGLAACLPLLMSQRTAYTTATWVPAATPAMAAEFVRTFVFPTYLVAVPLVAFISALAPGRRAARAGTVAVGLQVGLLALALLPVVLVAFSFTCQSVLVNRYSLAAVAALGPAVAFLLRRTGRVWIIALCGAAVLLGVREMGDLAAGYRYRDHESDELCALVGSRHGDGVILFENAHTLFVAQHYGPDPAQPYSLLDFEKGDAPAGRSNVFARDLVRQHVRFYATPSLLKWSEVRALPRFYLVVDRAGNSDESCSAAYPGFTAHRLEGPLFEMIANSVNGDKP